MHLRLIFIFVILVLVGADGFSLFCSRKSARNHKVELLVFARNSPYFRPICRAVDSFMNTRPCNRIYADRHQEWLEARTKEGYREIEELKQKLSAIKQICSLPIKEFSFDMDKCEVSFEKKLSKCLSNALMEILLGIPLNEEDKMICSVYNIYSKCFNKKSEHKDKEICTNEAGRALKKTLKFPEDIQENCEKSKISRVLNILQNVDREDEFVFEPKFVPDEIKCDRDKAYDTKVLLYFISGLDRSYEDICVAAINIRDRLNNYTEKCREAERFQEIEELKHKMDPIVQLCPGKDRKVPVGVEQCLQSLEEKLRQCVIDALKEASSGSEFTDEKKLICSNYLFVAKCIVLKDEEECGQVSGQIILMDSEERINLPVEIKDSCSNSVIKDSLNAMAYGVPTRRE